MSFWGVVEEGRSEVTKAYLSAMFRCSIHEIASVILRGQGGKVTKAYLSEMFQNSHHFWDAVGRSKVTKAYPSKNILNSIIPKGYYSIRLVFYEVRFMR